MTANFTNPNLLISEVEFPAPRFPVYRFSVEEYLGMAEAGVLANASVELLEGVIVPKMTRNSWHDATLGIVEELIAAWLQKGWTTRVQMALVAADSVPEPDLAIVQGSRRDYLLRRPTGADAALVIEVADSSLVRDREKASIYAEANVPVYWIINGQDRCVELFEQPTRNANGMFTYAKRKVLRGSDTLSIVINGVNSGSLTCDQLVPPLPSGFSTSDPT